jgi:response regulator RpfG family c-di-GMP phosphodiesterase
MPDEKAFRFDEFDRIWSRNIENNLLLSPDVNREMMLRLLMAAEYRDDDTGKHVIRVGKFCRIIAESHGLSGEYLDLIEIAAPMHDVGKIGIPDNILLKPAKLTKGEFEQMKKHTLIGARILSDSKYAVFNMAKEISMTHHEKWDGTGYPNGLKGKDIPLTGRITAVADVFDALLSRRPYKDPNTWEDSLAVIDKENGIHFDPDVLASFHAKLDKIKKIYTEYQDDVKCASKCVLPDTLLRR